ncbi:uncharacterized protein LOC134177078 [Corticium candelabrum]|uniref:uncharacterized protein LOC134177078 n=1 Tax=Corticium candelabrum TaxID=121492 RepID=UPI002E260639|nr:uncharacterized protein LOC134177078 [Corticium candelabrum]
MAISSYCGPRSTSKENERSESVQVESSCTYSKDQLNNQEAIPSAWGGSVRSDPEMSFGNMLTTTGGPAYETDNDNTPGSGKGDQPSSYDETSKSVREVPETSKDQSKDEVIRCCPCTQQIIKVVNRRMDECCDMAQDTRDEMLSSISGAFANRDATETAL